MWGIFCLGCCCPGEACFSNALTSVSAQAGTSKNHPSKRQMTEMKWSPLHLTDSEKRFHHLYHRVPHWALSGPPGVDGDTQQAGLGQVSKVKLPIESSKCIQSLNILSCLLKIPIAHQRSLFSWLSAIYALDFEPESLAAWTSGGRHRCWCALTKILMTKIQCRRICKSSCQMPLRDDLKHLMHWMPRLKLLVSPELHVFGLRVNLSDVTVCCCELSQCREA